MPISEGVAAVLVKQETHNRKLSTRDKTVKKQHEAFIKPASTGQPDIFHRRFFINEQNTGVVSTNTGRKAEGLIKNENVELSADLRSQYARYMKDYIHNLSEVTRRDPNALASEPHAHDRRLLAELIDKDGKPDNAKIDELFNSPAGWIIANQVLEHNAPQMLAALGGLTMALRPPGRRQDVGEQGSIRLPMDQGVLNRVFHRYISPSLMQRVYQTAGRPMQEIFGRAIPPAVRDNLRRWHLLFPAAEGSAVVMGAGAVVGAVAGGPGGAAIGAGVAEAGAAAAVAVANMFRSGVRLDIRNSQAFFNTVAGNATERAFVHQMIGINTENYQYNAAGQVEVAPGREANLEADIRGIQEQLLGALHTRFQFYKELGIPPEQIDAMPEQALLLQSPNVGLRPEQTATWWQKEMAARFTADPLVGAQQNIENFNAARLDVMGGMLNEYFGEKYRTANEARMLDSIHKKNIARESGGGLHNNRSEGIRNARNALNTDRLSLGGGVAEGGVRRAGEQQSLEGYQTTIEDLRTTEDALRNELRKVGRYANPDAAISALEDVLTPGTAQITIDGRTIFNTSTALGTLETKKQNSIRDATNIIVRRTRPPESDDSLGHRMDQYLRSIDAQYETEKARIQENVDAIRNEITEIRRLQREVNTRQTALNETNQDAIRVRQLSGELSQQYQNLTTWGITDAQLQSETIEQLLSRINAANTTNPANGGWTAEQNTRPDLRMRVHHAIIESRARQANPTALAAPPAEYVTLTAPTGLNITDTQLLSLTPAQIRAEMNRLRRRNPGYPANATEAQIVTAKRIAQERFQARSSAYTEHIAEIDERLAQMDGAEDRISFGDEKLLLDTAESLMTRASEIYGRVSEEVGVNPLITDTAALTPADTQYSQQERDAALPRSYYALMNILFNYQGENRGANFEKLQRLFPPDELARIMAPRLGIVPAGGAAVNINNFTLQLSTDITNRVTTSLEVRRAMQDVIIYFRDQADALE